MAFRDALFAIVSTLAGVAVPLSAHAGDMELELSRLSTGACTSTLNNADDFTLQRADGTPTLHRDRADYAALASALQPVTFAPVYAPLSTMGARSFAVSIDTLLVGLDSGSQALQRGTRGGAVRTCDGRNGNVSRMLVGNRIRVEKGLPLGISVGAHGGRIHDVGLYVAGAYGKVGLLEGFDSPLIPDIILRVASSALAGNSALGLFTWQADLTASKRVRVGRAELAPYAGLSLLATRVSSARVDLTPNIDALACARGSDPVCTQHGLSASNADYGHDQRFPTLWLGRLRATVGAMVRVGLVALLLEGGFDLLRPHTLAATVPNDAARQWHVSLAPTLVY